jgi:hypothetical protein
VLLATLICGSSHDEVGELHVNFISITAANEFREVFPRKSGSFGIANTPLTLQALAEERLGGTNGPLVQ